MVGGSVSVIVHGHGVGCIGHRANELSYPITLIVPGSVGWVKGAVSWNQKSCLDRSVSMPTESPQPANLRASGVLKRGGRLQMADILLEPHVTPEEVASKGSWSD